MRRKTAVILISFLTASTLALGVFAFTRHRQAQRLEYFARIQSEHVFEEVVTSLSELSNSLEKSVYVTDPALQSALCTQVYGRAVLAQMALGMLPYESRQLEQTAGFVSTVGDYACVLAKSVTVHDGYTREELENLGDLSETAGVLAQNLRDLRQQMNLGTVTADGAFAAETAVEEQGESTGLSGAISDMESEFPELPVLIYDGPFSEGIRRDEPAFLQGMEQVSEEEARRLAAKALDVTEEEVSPAGDCGGDIPLWCFTAKLAGGEYWLQMTKQGGQLYSLLCSRSTGTANYSVPEGLAMAEKYLKALGLEDMKESYYVVQNDVLTVNYEYEQDGVLCYPDLVKLSVALDNGTLMSYDAAGYISAHRVRDMPETLLSEEDALAQVGEGLTTEGVNLVVIPTDGGQEKLCYEVICSGGEHRCLLYVNAVSGRQERILLLLEDEFGSLTI